VSEWTGLPGAGGTLLALAGDRTAAAQLGRLTVWDGEREIACVEGAVPGRPRITDGAVLWGEVELVGNNVKRVAGLQGAPTPAGFYRVAASAWTPDGEAVVTSAAWTGPPGRPEARVVLHDAGGEPRATLWEASDLAPKALWAGERLIVVGSREPRVYARDGTLVNTLTGRTPPVRVEADAAEERLLVVEHGALTVWSTATWEPLERRDGAWLDAAMAPDGGLVVAVDLAGALHGAPLAASDPVQAVALGDGRIAACFARAPIVRTAAV
jgi:hypothetical protein